MEPHEILARVAIEASREYAEVYLPAHYAEHGALGKSGVLIPPQAYIAAALKKHMVPIGTFWSETNETDYTYRITDKPQEASDGTGD